MIRIGKVVSVRHRDRLPSVITIRPLNDSKGRDAYKYEVDLLVDALKFKLGTELLFIVEGRMVKSAEILTPEQELLRKFVELKVAYHKVRLEKPLELTVVDMDKVIYPKTTRSGYGRRCWFPWRLAVEKTKRSTDERWSNRHTA